MNVVIIGCGLIGRKRALALDKEDILTACCDTNLDIAKKFGEDFHCSYFTDYKKLFLEINCDTVIVSVINKYAKDIIIKALGNGKHVIAEKPLGRNYEEAEEMVGAAESGEQGAEGKEHGAEGREHLVLKTGFNHRFHLAIWKAKQLADEGMIGKIFNIRARYGHGGRQGMEKEWRASKDLCGGGELLDQGVHVIDLIRWFGGEVKEVVGKVETKFWDMEVEDNASAILKTKNGVTAAFSVSWTNWKNIFSFEIFGTGGYLKIEGLGGSYGPETLEFGKRKPEGGKPDIEFFEFPSEDVSWKKEWEEFKNAVKEKREPVGSGYDGLKANEVIRALYKSNEQSKTILL
jgi:predicted dehydrogenase